MKAPEFVVYAEGLCFASVCTRLSDQQAAARMPEAGGDLVWRIAEQPFRAGTPDEVPNGSPCPQHPLTNRHLLFEC